MKNVLTIVLMILLFGLVGRMEYNDAVVTSKQDKINKQEYIKDVQLRCYKGELNDNMLCNTTVK